MLRLQLVEGEAVVRLRTGGRGVEIEREDGGLVGFLALTRNGVVDPFAGRG